jgi:hypothetical protein
MTDIRILSIRAPWWFYILHRGKRIENRDWHTDFRGPILIHASSWFDADEIMLDSRAARDMQDEAGFVSTTSITLGEIRKLGGHIVGRAEIVDCVDHHPSPWFMGRYGIVLKDARPLADPIPHKGMLGLQHAPQDIIDRIGA